MKTIINGYGPSQGPPGNNAKGKPARRKWAMAAMAAVLIVPAAAMLHAAAWGPPDIPDVLDARTAATERQADIPGAGGADILDRTGTGGMAALPDAGITVHSVQRYVAYEDEVPLGDTERRDTEDAEQLSVAPDPVDGDPEPEAADTASVKETAVTEPVPEAVREAPAEEPEQLPVKAEPVTEPAVEAPAGDADAAAGQLSGGDGLNADGLPIWLFGDGAAGTESTEAGPPEWLFVTGEPALTPLESTLLRYPYDGGPLSQCSYTEVPVPDMNGTRIYCDFGMPLSWLTQGDLANFAVRSVQGSGALYATILDGNGYGLEFPGCGIDFAVYGPVNEYGQVSDAMYLVALGMDGYYVM